MHYILNASWTYNYGTCVVLRDCIFYIYIYISRDINSRCCSCFQGRKQPASCSPLQLCSCILIQTFLKGECFLLPVVMIVVVLSNLYSVYRLQSEVDEVLGSKENVSVEDLEKLQYTEQVYVLDNKHSCLYMLLIQYTFLVK